MESASAALAHVARGGLDVAGGFGELAREVAVAHGHVDVGAGVDAGSERDGRLRIMAVCLAGAKGYVYTACGRSGQIAAGGALGAACVGILHLP